MHWPELVVWEGPRIPLLEVSGLACAPGGSEVLAVGDRSTQIAVATVIGDEIGTWQIAELTSYSGLAMWDRADQIEAIAVDGGSLLVAIQEVPPRALVADRETRRNLRIIPLAAQGLGRRARDWEDGSAGEGVVLLADGHLLVVKEKNPALLIEFGPPGEQAGGFGPGRWLAPGQPWPYPPGDAEFVPLASWRVPSEAAQLLPDISEAAVAPDGRLLLTSDQGGSVAAVAAGLPAQEHFHVLAGGFLPGIKGKLEGLAVLPGGTLMLATDRAKTKDNCYLMSYPF